MVPIDSGAGSRGLGNPSDPDNCGSQGIFMSVISGIYLLLAAVGAIVPFRHFLIWFDANGVSITGLIEAWTVNAAAEGMLYDLALAAVALIAAVVVDVARRGASAILVVIPVTLLIGVSCGLPLYLWFRHQMRDKARSRARREARV